MKTVVDSRFSSYADEIRQWSRLMEEGGGETVYDKRWRRMMHEEIHYS